MSFAVIAALLVPSHAKDPWDFPPMEAPASAWHKFADAQVDTDDAVTMLHIDTRLSFDEEGRKRRITRVVYQVEDPEKSAGWSNVSRTFAPWLQDAPTVQARVIHPTGETFDFDPSTLSTFGPKGDDPRMYSDRRTLRGPLPRMVPKAIVEEIWDLQDHTPFLAGGGSSMEWLAYESIDTLHTDLTVTAPASVPLNWVLHGSDTKIKAKTKGGLQSIHLELDASPALPEWANSYYLDRPASPVLEVSTWESWSTINDAYGKLVQDRFDATGLEDIVAEVKAAPDGAEALRRAVRGVQDRIRYTGLELGQKSIVPYTPAETIQRGFGDCKDSATAVIAVMRAAGHEASLALLSSGRHWQPAEPLPGMNFNHAIVYAPSAPAQFVDITATNTGIESLPISVQHRHALIVDPATDAVRLTPFTQATQVDVRTIDMRDGLGDLQEVNTYRGWAHDNSRAEYLGKPLDFTEYTENGYEPMGEMSFNATGLDVDSPEWTLDIRAKDILSARIPYTGGTVTVWGGDFGNPLPSYRNKLVDSLDSEEVEGFGTPVRPTRYDLTWNVELPPLVVATELPPTVHETVGLVSIDSEWSTRPGQITGKVSVAVEGGSVPLADLSRIREIMDSTELVNEWNIPVEIPESLKLQRSPEQTMAALTQGDDLISLAATAEAWADLGQTRASERLLRTLHSEYPTSEVTQRMGFIASLFDAWGRDKGVPADRALVIETARSLDCDLPGTTQLMRFAVSMLLTDEFDQTTTFTTEARLSEALELATTCKKAADGDVDTEFNITLAKGFMELGRLEEASTALEDEEGEVALLWKTSLKLDVDADSSTGLENQMRKAGQEASLAFLKDVYTPAMAGGQWQVIRSLMDSKAAAFGAQPGEAESMKPMGRLGKAETPKPTNASTTAAFVYAGVMEQSDSVKPYLSKSTFKELRKSMGKGLEVARMMDMTRTLMLACDRKLQEFDDLSQVRFQFVGNSTMFDAWMRKSGKRWEVVDDTGLPAKRMLEAVDAGDLDTARRWGASLHQPSKSTVNSEIAKMVPEVAGFGESTLRLMAELFLHETGNKPAALARIGELVLKPADNDRVARVFFNDDTPISKEKTALALARLQQPFGSLAGASRVATYAAGAGHLTEALKALEPYKDASPNYMSHEAWVLLGAGETERAYTLVKSLPVSAGIGSHVVAAYAGLYAGEGEAALQSWFAAIQGKKSFTQQEDWIFAALLLEAGRITDAQNVFTRGKDGSKALPPNQWRYLRARLAQAYGLGEDAKADLEAFRKGPLPVHMRPWAKSVR